MATCRRHFNAAFPSYLWAVLTSLPSFLGVVLLSPFVFSSGAALVGAAVPSFGVVLLFPLR